MARRFAPSWATQQRDVEAGEKTDVYYIPVSNLPLSATWQDLKDHTRTVCAVDRVEVFQGSTTGWVRVKGRENFEKAFGLLNGGEIEGRPLVACDRNRTCSMKIKEIRRTSPCHVTLPFQPLHHEEPFALPYVPDTPTTYVQSLYSETSSPGVRSPLGIQSQVAQSLHCTSPAPSTPEPTSGGYFTINFHAEDCGGVSIAPRRVNGSGNPPPQRPERDWMSHMFNQGLAALTATSIEYLIKENRMILLLNVVKRASDEDIIEWIEQKTKQYAEHICSVFLPRKGRSLGKNDGKVFIGFETTLIAKRALRFMNQNKFRGRTVSAKMAKKFPFHYPRSKFVGKQEDGNAETVTHRMQSRCPSTKRCHSSPGHLSQRSPLVLEPRAGNIEEADKRPYPIVVNGTTARANWTTSP